MELIMALGPYQKDLLHKESIVYLCGAGTDISFDIAIARIYGCTIHIFDPTPRSISHMGYVIESLSLGKPTWADYVPGKFENPSSQHQYILDPEKVDQIKFYPVGIWNENKMMKFYAPPNPNYVSHSIPNLRDTKTFFEAECKNLVTIMKELGHNRIDLLKMDIEGAEYQVIDHIVEHNIDITCLCVEFDEFAGRAKVGPPGAKERVQARINKLLDNGYKIVYKDTFADMTFVKKDYLLK